MTDIGNFMYFRQPKYIYRDTVYSTQIRHCTAAAMTVAGAAAALPCMRHECESECQPV